MRRKSLPCAQPVVAVSSRKQTPARAATKRSQVIIESDDDDEDVLPSKVCSYDATRLTASTAGRLLWQGHIASNCPGLCVAGSSSTGRGRCR